jgi:hypothetical protein
MNGPGMRKTSHFLTSLVTIIYIINVAGLAISMCESSKAHSPSLGLTRAHIALGTLEVRLRLKYPVRRLKMLNARSALWEIWYLFGGESQAFALHPDWIQAHLKGSGLFGTLVIGLPPCLFY